MTAASHFVPSGSVSVHVQDWGGSGPTVLLIHGSAHQGSHWRHVAPLLTRHFRVLTPDLRGHGGSGGGPEDAYDLNTLVNDAIAVLDAFGAERAAVVGQSLGGRIAYGMAALHPRRVERLVVVDMSPTASPGSLTFWQNMAGLLPENLPSRSEAEAWMQDRQMEFLADALRESPDGSCRFDLNLPALVGMAAQTSSVDLWGLAAQITCPTLVIRGTLSPYVDDQTAMRLSQMPGFAVAGINAGHAVHLEAPEALTDRILHFLR